jgi:hypothetical protein
LLHKAHDLIHILASITGDCGLLREIRSTKRR